MIDKSKLNAVEKDLIDGLEGFVADLKGNRPLEKKYTCRRVVLDLKRGTYTASRVKSTRRLMNASQELFAQFLGVSVQAVRKWESGSARSEMASRFLDEIRRNPEYWKSRLRESIKIRTAKSKR